MLGRCRRQPAKVLTAVVPLARSFLSTSGATFEFAFSSHNVR